MRKLKKPASPAQAARKGPLAGHAGALPALPVWTG